MTMNVGQEVTDVANPGDEACPHVGHVGECCSSGLPRQITPILSASMTLSILCTDTSLSAHLSDRPAD